MNVREAKERIGDIYRLADLLHWPLVGQSPELAWWRGNSQSPALSIFADDQLWKDHATGESGDMVDLLAQVEGLPKGKACARIVRIAEGVTAATPTRPRITRVSSDQKRSEWPAMVSSLSPFANGAYAGASEAENGLLVGRGTLLRAIGTVAHRRNFPFFQGVQAASRRGLLVFLDWFEAGDSRPVPAWGLTDSSRNAAQVRRLDGKPWQVRETNCKSPKSKSMPGSVGGWPIGIAEVGARTDIILTEGEPDLLAALTLHCLTARSPDNLMPRDPGTFGFCCMTGKSKPIAESALPYFAGKTVRIVPHIDAAPNQSPGIWGDQLPEAGATVKLFDLTGLTKDDDTPAKDLNDVITNRGIAKHYDQVSQLFSK